MCYNVIRDILLFVKYQLFRGNYCFYGMGNICYKLWKLLTTNSNKYY